MPVIDKSTYGNFLSPLRSGHLETIFPSLFREIKDVRFTRERINTPDNDFLDLDWLQGQFNKLVIISHGLEGSTERHYIKSCARYFHQRGYDVLAWNYRSCGQEMNLNLRLYHHGVTDDFETVVNYAVNTRRYKRIGLVGYSMGGSTTLKYLGEYGASVPKHVVAAAVFSVPCNLWNSAHQLTFRGNIFYRKRFLKKLIEKVKRKHEQFPDLIDITGIDEIHSFSVFDEKYTAPIHGFRSARHFYESASSDLHYHSIKVPSLIVNAINDPLLGGPCYPYTICQESKFLTLETPKCGGHVGFRLRGKNYSWMDQRAFEYIDSYMKDWSLH
ncbi:alpha/beta fold hydrolase [Reichenbachiella agarivorans]|uniref:Alpha/beta fold hydrolase n=1 Tax=Reichenbachiella agarivorans TaxID=2979464 RepID=A0ABY6CPR2_9BACT|nr:alpha/beta fold hydrolase [Reichenbachiella agarivorans]UXP32496.1 alpha/beta fold hydrolase [Reichenbachiella agarivorans]